GQHQRENGNGKANSNSLPRATSPLHGRTHLRAPRFRAPWIAHPFTSLYLTLPRRSGPRHISLMARQPQVLVFWSREIEAGRESVIGAPRSLLVAPAMVGSLIRQQPLAGSLRAGAIITDGRQGLHLASRRRASWIEARVTKVARVSARF